MVRTWLTAAAAAGSLSSAVPSEVTTDFSAQQAETRPHVGPRSERARIVAIAHEVRRLVVRYADAHSRAVVAPRALSDLGIDDLALADVVLGLEARFDIDIEDAEAGRWETVGDVVGFVAKRVRESRATLT
jgi:acyl carrier protein